MKQKPKRRIAVFLYLSFASGRDLLTGIFRYARECGHWGLQLVQMPEYLTPEIRKRVDSGCFDGIITTGEASGGFPDYLLKTSTPVSLIGIPGGAPAGTEQIAYVTTDNLEIGRLAARTALKAGAFRTFGFVPNTDGAYWRKGREAGFLGAAGHGIRRVTYPGQDAPGSERDRRLLRNWLLALPKPAALLAEHDIRAAQVLELCKEADISVPDEVTVIGVDNDTLICDFTDPPLTSVMPDHEQIGYLAAKELERLIRKSKRTAAARVTVCPPKGVACRESAIAVAPAAQLIERAKIQIARTAAKAPRPADVAAALHVSRRLLEMRFRQFERKSIAETIISERLKLVRHALRETKRSVKSIAEGLGFANANSLRNIFRRQYGLSMSEYRAHNTTSSPS